MDARAHLDPAHLAHLDRMKARLVLRRDAVGWGEHSDDELGAQVAAGDLVRILHGAYVQSAEWQPLYPGDRVLARTLAAAQLNAQRGWVFTHSSAASLWGLPLVGLQDTLVHIATDPKAPGQSSRMIRRHLLELEAGEVTVVEGVRVTSLERTLLDLAHSAPAELAVPAADAGLRRLWGCTRDVPEQVIAEWRHAQTQRLRRSFRPGVRRARAVVNMTDPRSDSPVESLSRLQLERLGIPYQVQVPVTLDHGRTVWMDFEFPGQAAFGEVDGLAKYRDPALLGARTSADVVLAEKVREDEVRGVTGKRVVRWTPEHLTSARELGTRLRRFGVRVPGLP